MSASKALLDVYGDTNGCLEASEGNFPETQAWEDDVTHLKRALGKKADKIKLEVVKRTNGPYRGTVIESGVSGTEDDDMECLFRECPPREGEKVGRTTDSSWASDARRLERGFGRLVRQIPDGENEN